MLMTTVVSASAASAGAASAGAAVAKGTAMRARGSRSVDEPAPVGAVSTGLSETGRLGSIVAHPGAGMPASAASA